ncbi:TRAM domain-containing protein [Haloarchaeobius sp. TZWSO28]|uniref:TRAM domain-containing protein n=1 Tax=Haloarchaeobius sp. TZWSO28 TaxID=3446119 RepID=UPI003EB6F89C
MTEIPSSLRALFTAHIHQHDDSYVLEVPSSEINSGTLELGDKYRVALLESSTTRNTTAETTRTRPDAQPIQSDEQSGPPVEEGEIRDLTIETVGDKGDGIAKVERGYVVIVPDARPGDEPTVKIENVQENVAFAKILD